jgi:hypothetical protein
VRKQSLAVLVACAAVGAGLIWLVIATSAGDIGESAGIAEGAPTPVIPAESGRLEVAVDTARAPVQAAPKETPPSIFVSGLVVDQLGRPLPGAHVSVTDPEGKELAATDANAMGWFELRGHPSPLRLLARASKAGYIDSKPKGFVRGDKDVQLALSEGCAVGGRILVDDWIDVDRMELRLTPSSWKPDLPLPKWTKPASAVEDDGTFLLDGIDRAVEVDLEVSYAKEPVVGGEVRGIRVREVGVSEDPRLDPLDLRGFLDPLTIEVIDETGSRLRHARVVVRGVDGAELDRCRGTAEGFARFLLPARSYDVEVEAQGWRRARAKDVSGHRVVRLERGIPVRIRLDDRVTLPPRPYRLAIALLADVEEPLDEVDGTGAFDDSRTAAFVVSSAGPHRVAWYLVRDTSRYFVSEANGVRLEIPDSSAEQEVRVGLSAEVRSELASTIERLERGG